MIPSPGTYHIWTVGCQMNKSDSERFAATLEALGLRPAPIESADVIVLNSCSVRQSAEQRALSKLGSLQAPKRRRPGLFVVLAGCMVGENQAGLCRQHPLVDSFVPAGDAEALAVAVSTRLEASGAVRSCASSPADRVTPHEPGGICRWVPIIHGCNQFCSYCIVPYRRGRERSHPIAEVVADVEAAAASGAKEVTLLGQNVDAYGRDLPERPGLADLLAAVDAVPGLARLRFLTSHPRHMSDGLIRAVADLPKVCEHINLPVQSGDDDILRAMRRGYSRQEYLELTARIRAAIPDASLSTDVIVGFPGETDEQFRHTYDLLAEIGFDVVHVAMYSPRPGTAAAEMADDVPAEEKKRRLLLVEELQERLVGTANAFLVGNTVEVLVEGHKGGKWFGRTRSNKLVFFTASGNWLGWLGPVEITSSTAWSLQGAPASASPGAAPAGRREMCPA